MTVIYPHHGEMRHGIMHQVFNCSLTHFAGTVALFLCLTMTSTTKILVIHDFEQISYEAKKIRFRIKIYSTNYSYNHNHL